MYLRLLVSAVALAVVSCQNTYYGVMERFGWEKRDLLVDRVEEARDTQAETKEQFRDALTQFSAIVNYDGGTWRSSTTACGGSSTTAKGRPSACATGSMPWRT